MCARVLHLPIELSLREIRAREGQYVTELDYDLVLDRDDVDVYSATGQWVLTVRHSAELEATAPQFLTMFRQLPGDVKGRGKAVYAGAVVPVPRKDGSISRIHRMQKLEGLEDSVSRMIGYRAPDGKNPYGHPSDYLRDHPEAVDAMLSWFQLMDQAFAAITPQFHAAQLAVAQKIPDWIVPGTSFTGITVNRNWRTALHRDATNYGPSIMTAIVGGQIEPSSGLLVFPRHRVAVKVTTGIVLISNTHLEPHGNMAILGVPEQFWRLTFIGFLHPRLLNCGSRAAEEAKRLRWIETLKSRRAR